MSITFNGCVGITASIPSVVQTCGNCYEAVNGSRGDKMFARFDLKRRTGINGTFTTFQTKWVPNGFSASFSITGQSPLNDFMVEAYTSSVANNCFPAFNTSPISCPGQWNSFDESDVFEIGFPGHTVEIIDLEDGNDNSIFCEDDISPSNGGVSFQTIFSNADRGYQVQICMINQSNPTNCFNQKGTGWLPGKLPPTFNLLTDLWRTSPNNEWRFWSGFTYRVTVAITSLPCSGWESRTFEFVVEENGC